MVFRSLVPQARASPFRGDCRLQPWCCRIRRRGLLPELVVPPPGLLRVLVPVVVLAAFVTLCFVSARGKSWTTDERKTGRVSTMLFSALVGLHNPQNRHDGSAFALT